MTCAICGGIGTSATANTGRDEYFGPPVTSLKPIFDSRDNDLRQCPECSALYVWHEYVAFTGSGNNDDETVTRLPEPLQSWLRAFEQRADDTPPQIDELAEHLFVLSETERDLVLGYMMRHRDALPALIPHYLAQAIRRKNEAIAKELESRASRDRDFAQRVLAAIDASPSALFDSLAKVARLAQCSVCGTVSFERFAPGTVPPTHAQFRKLTGTNEDIWECTECGTFFKWQPSLILAGEQTLDRIAEWQAKTLRAVLHRKVPDAIDVEQLKDTMYWGRRELSVLSRYAIERDQTLARALAPLIAGKYATSKEQWLGDLVARFEGRD